MANCALILKISLAMLAFAANSIRGLRANGTKTYAKEITNCYN